jgi:glutathione synthase/RimK-type ligase-like ATP-grasp enzyme
MSECNNNPDGDKPVCDKPVCDGATDCDNPVCDDETKEQSESPPKVNLLEVNIDNEQVALNVIIGFLGVAQRRGVFAMNESAKIFECVNKFQTQKQ